MPMFYVPFVVATSDGAASTAFDISKVMTDAVTSGKGEELKLPALFWCCRTKSLQHAGDLRDFVGQER